MTRNEKLGLLIVFVLGTIFTFGASLALSELAAPKYAPALPLKPTLAPPFQTRVIEYRDC